MIHTLLLALATTLTLTPTARAELTTWIYDEAGIFTEGERSELAGALEELQKYGAVRMVVITSRGTAEPAPPVRATAAAEGAPEGERWVALTIAPLSRRITLEAGPGLREALAPRFLKRVVDEFVAPGLGKGRAFDGVHSAIAAVARKSGYTLTEWADRRMPASRAVNPFPLIVAGIVALGFVAFWTVTLFRMGVGGAVIVGVILSSAAFVAQGWEFWLPALFFAWLAAIVVLSRFQKLRLPTEEEPGESQTTPPLPPEGATTHPRFLGGRAGSRW